MVAGHLREQNGVYQVILNWMDSSGRRRSKSISTGLQIKGNKKRAEAILRKMRAEFNPKDTELNSGMNFDQFLEKWLQEQVSLMSPSEYAEFSYCTSTSILPYFKKVNKPLAKMTSTDIEDYFNTTRSAQNCPTSLLVQLHKTLVLCFSYAINLGWIKENPALSVNPFQGVSQILFTDYLKDWLHMMEANVRRTTFAGYSKCVLKDIIPYFEEHHPGLRLIDVTAMSIQGFYTYEKLERGLSTNTIRRRHANIRKALQYAFINDLIPANPAAKVELPGPQPYQAHYYNAKQLEAMFTIFKGDPAEFGVITAAFYGLRRGEIIGLKWDAIDFDDKTIMIRHTVTDVYIDGKLEIMSSDTTKTKSSYRTLPLVPAFEEILLKMKAEQARNKKLCGRSYCTDYLDYIYVNPLGELIRPDFLSHHVPDMLVKHNMPRIRFHDLRHSCASLLYANGIPMKDIQAWLGHSTIATTANIYTHLKEESKINSANAISSILPPV